MIKKVCAILVAFLFFQTSVFALSIPTQDESIYVNDYSSVLSETTKSELISMNQESDYETGGYVVVATFDFVDEDLYDFSYRLFNEWGIGSSEYNNGVLLVLDIGNDNYCYIIGSGLETYLSDSECWDIIDNYMEPYFAKQDYDQAVLKTTEQFLKVIESNFEIEDSVIVDDSQEEQNVNFGLFTGIASIAAIFVFGLRILIPIIFILVFFVIVRSIFGRRRYRGYYDRPMFGPMHRRHYDPFAPRPNRDFNSRNRSFGGRSSSFGRSSGFGGSRSSSSFGGSRGGSHHSGGSSRGAGGTRR